MKTLPLLLKREYWEHRGGFLWAPIWITGSILVISVLGMISAEVFRSHAQVHIGISLDDLRGSISADDMAKAGNGLDVAQLMFTGLTSIGLFFVTFFYLLGALYDDRRDRSVLFWKSLPVSDTATVVSKALTAMLVIPLFSIAVATVAYLVFLVLVCAWVGAHGLNPLNAVLASHPIGMFLRILATLPISALWALPTVGWLLFWSAYARSKPFLWAVLLPIVAIFANWWVGKIGGLNLTGDLNLASILGRLLLSIMPGSWVSADGVTIGATRMTLDMQDEHIVRAFDPALVYGLLGNLNLWIGVAAGVALLAGSIWLRGRRIETNT
jgi:ABC-2 type transport system permease protein